MGQRIINEIGGEVFERWPECYSVDAKKYKGIRTRHPE